MQARKSSTKNPKVDQTEISSLKDDELDDISKYGKVGWEGHTPISNPAVKNVNKKSHKLEKYISEHNDTKKHKAEPTIEHISNGIAIRFSESEESTESSSCHKNSNVEYPNHSSVERRPSFCCFYKPSSTPLSVHPMETRSKTKMRTTK